MIIVPPDKKFLCLVCNYAEMNYTINMYTDEGYTVEIIEILEAKNQTDPDQTKFIIYFLYYKEPGQEYINTENGVQKIEYYDENKKYNPNDTFMYHDSVYIVREKTKGTKAPIKDINVNPAFGNASQYYYILTIKEFLNGELNPE